ncbi:EF-Tu/IF-2/RF-3 family GTPase [Mycobacterium sp. RTGN5]|uniref:EF-Tu/IF-2/RF-3 family GTPase n=1 Tax=Mycobacterium sp. RTGN5 TaxID=3016522 RepID=UPI0029C66D5C|nr:EF-Tu/IF-2/RF-3 family GTPase [Mycobacterium sp. RTGN5]
MFRLTVQDVFFIKGRGLVATGHVEAGEVRVGDEVRINGARAVQVEAIERFRKKLDSAAAGDNVGLLFSGLDRTDLASGDVLTSGAGEPASGGVEVSL